MNSDQLRELADILEPMAAAPRFDGLPVAEFCAWLRQCAEQRPVAYKHTESDGGMTYFVADEAPCEKCVPLYASPVPPQREPLSDSDADYWLRHRHAILDAIHRAGFVLMSNASGFWLQPAGKTETHGIGGSDGN